MLFWKEAHPFFCNIAKSTFLGKSSNFHVMITKNMLISSFFRAFKILTSAADMLRNAQNEMQSHLDKKTEVSQIVSVSPKLFFSSKHKWLW